MDNFFDLTTDSDGDKEMASPKMVGKFTMSNQEGFSRVLDKYQASDDVQRAGGPSRPFISNKRRRCQRVTTQEQQRERKKEIDRAFRQRRKEQENQMKENFHLLKEENTSLVRENRVLMTERDSMAHNLQSAAMETQQLQSEILGLNRDIATGQQFVDLYSNQLVATNTSHRVFELKQLEIENEILSQTHWENWDSEKEGFMQNMASSEVENKSLKLQLQALSEFIIKH